jgi:hypothetical protein
MLDGIASSTGTSKDGLRGNVVRLLVATMCHALCHAEGEDVAKDAFVVTLDGDNIRITSN